MGFRDRLQNLKDSVGQWADSASVGSLDKKIEKNLTEMSAGTEIERTAAIKALVIQAQTEEKWLDPIIDSFLRVLPGQIFHVGRMKFVLPLPSYSYILILGF